MNVDITPIGSTAAPSSPRRTTHGRRRGAAINPGQEEPSRPCVASSALRLRLSQSNDNPCLRCARPATAERLHFRETRKRWRRTEDSKVLRARPSSVDVVMLCFDFSEEAELSREEPGLSSARWGSAMSCHRWLRTPPIELK